KLKTKRGTLLTNKVMLYILTFSNYLLSLVVVPYEARVLNPELFGLLGTATAIMVYFQLVMDFGYLLSGTQEVALQRDNKKELCRIFTAITIGKILLIAVSAVALQILCSLIPAWRDKRLLLTLFFVAAAVNTLLPDYLYRGLEKMSSITVRTVCIKLFFTVGIFVVLKEPEDIWKIPLITAIGNAIAVVATLIHLSRKLGIRLQKPDIHAAWQTMRRSSTFFYSRIASTAYSALNTVILDIISGTGAVVGFYNSADKLITTGKSAVSPISDSLYPYMVKNRDFKLVKKVLLLLEPIIFVFCACCFIWAEPLCLLFFGPEYGPAGDVLRAMLPVGVIVLPSYILGFPMLTAMDLTKHANYSVIFGSAVHVINLVILYLTGNISMITLGVAVSVAEALILGYRIVVIWIHRDRIRKEQD
ncbi:MAG: oligosaccharide flippase family protein, partial [Oscillospiraceae bacterium]|nr:oligosaccharide flippase family protein [Oscillospiraceae bacterium]